MIGLIGINLAIMVVDVFVHWFRIERLWHKIQHIIETLYALVLYLLVDALLVQWADIPLNDAWGAIIVLPFQRWVVHDLLLNIARGLPLNYIGDGDGDAWTDQVLKSLNLDPWIVRIFCLFISFVVALIVSR